MLLLLDNARDAAQVLPLIPGTSGSAVLVTSRVRLAGIPGAVLDELAAPDELEALDLLAAVAGFARIAGEGPAARELVEACARLPLAVRIVASRLAARPGWSVEALLDRLRDEQRRLAELRVGDLAVEASFELGYRQLTPRQAWAFRLLSVPDGPGFATASAAALLGLADQDEAEELLESLVDTGLLEAEAIGRYRYHDLVRIFARQHAERADGAEAREQAVQRLLEFLLARVCAAQGPLAGDEELAWRLHVPAGAPVEGFPDDDSAWAWLRGERPGILAAAASALRLAPTRALHAVVDLLIGCIWLFEHESAGQGWGRLLDQALGRAVADRDTAAEGRLRYLQGLLHGFAGENARAEAELRHALGLLERDENLEIRYTVASELAVTLTASDRAEEALAYLERARLLAARLGHLPDEARLLSNIARGHLAAGRVEEARRVAEASLLTARASGNAHCLADAHYQLGNALAGSGDHQAALEHFAAGLTLYRSQRRSGYVALTLARMALSQAELGASGAALLLGEQALDAQAGSDSPYCRALALWATGLALRSTREQGRARICLEESLRLFEGLNAPEAEPVRTLVRSAGAGALIER
ncbi:tetratricopeptide repeat protein [Streptacidiphilus monticola]